MIETKLWDHLKLNVPSVSSRVFANIINQDTPKPALVYTVGIEIPGTMTCSSDKNYREWEITLYGESYSQNKDIKEEVVTALKSFEVDVMGIAIEDGYDTEAELYAQHIQFTTGRKNR